MITGKLRLIEGKVSLELANETCGVSSLESDAWERFWSEAKRYGLDIVEDDNYIELNIREKEVKKK